MLIDWFTVIAQALNFLILVGLMKHFLYKPVTGAIAAREKKIAAELAEAALKKDNAQKASDDFKHKCEVFDQERAALFTKAKQEAQAERDRLFTEARQDAAAMGLKQQEVLKSDEHNLFQTINLRAQQEIFAISRKALMDLAGTSLEERLVDVFIDRLRSLSVESKGRIIAALKSAQGPMIIRTAFGLSANLQNTVEVALKENFGPQAQIRFETLAELISGIELVVAGNKIAWNFADYLTSLQTGVDGLLKDKYGN